MSVISLGRRNRLTAEEQISLLDELLVHRRLILGRQLVGRDHSAYFVDGASNTTTGNESGQVTGVSRTNKPKLCSPIDKGLADSERAAHALESQTAIAFQ